MAGKTHPVQILPECEERFDTIARQLQQITLAIQKTGDSTIRTEVSIKGIWHELQDQKDLVRGLPDRISGSVQNHQRNCPALNAFYAKATAASSINPVGSQPAVNPALTETVGTGVFGLSNVPKKFWLFFVGIGISLGAAGYVLYQLGVFGN